MFVFTDIHCAGEDHLTPLHLVAKFKPSGQKEKKLELRPEEDDEGNFLEVGLLNTIVLQQLITVGATSA